MPLTIKKRGKLWHFSGTVAGRRLRGSCGTENKTVAQRIAAEREKKEWTRHLDGPAATLKFADAAMMYRMAEKPTRFLAKIEDYWKDTLVSEITPGAIRQSAIALYPSVSGATRNRQVIVPTQAIINHCAELEYCPTIRVRRFKVETKTKEPVTLEWVERFCAHASPHLAGVCMFMFGTGARLGEATALKWADVDLDLRTALIRQTKIGDERIAHLPPSLISALANIPSNRHPDEPVFQYQMRDSVRQPWLSAIKRAGIKKLSPHSCRHGFATTLLQAGVDVKTVAVRGGWKDVATLVKTYAHAATEKNVTDAIFGTELPQDKIGNPLTHYNIKKK